MASTRWHVALVEIRSIDNDLRECCGRSLIRRSVGKHARLHKHSMLTNSVMLINESIDPRLQYLALMTGAAQVCAPNMRRFEDTKRADALSKVGHRYDTVIRNPQVVQFGIRAIEVSCRNALIVND